MPKNAGGGSKSKKPLVNQDKDDEGSNIVFGDDSSKKRNKKHPATAVQQNDVTTPPGQEAPKKPDTRALIGGASWTGKLPVSLLSEHCQKQRWGKPEYTMSKSQNGFLSSVTLKSTDPKTKEIVTLPPFVLPSTHKDVAAQSTAVEARHFAATYALFRVCSMRNIHLMLPPTYRDLWKGEFESSKKEDIKAGRAWMYEADPFAAKQSHDESQAKKMLKKAEEEKKRSREATQSVSINFNSGMAGNASGKHVAKGWTQAPKLEMGKRNRTQVEELIRRTGIWNPHDTEFPRSQIDDAMKNITSLGFSAGHVEEAITNCRDYEEVLEWLLIHVPEDDLPTWSLPEGYTAGISMASGNLKRDAAVARLAESGYSVQLCTKTLDDCSGDEGRAAEALQSNLWSMDGVVLTLDLDEADSMQTWKEEQETLGAIFGHRYTPTSTSLVEISLQVEHLAACKLRIRRSMLYPKTLPTLSVISSSIPAHIRLSAIRQLLLFAESNLLGEPMVFNLIDWLENELPSIVDNPGKLRDVAAAITGPSPSDVTHKKRQADVKYKPAGKGRKSGSLESLELYNQWYSRQDTAEQKKMLLQRQALPAWKQKEAIIQAVDQNQVIIISGETGSGKSTQAVQFILDDLIQRQLGAAANLICTQPRRISALGLADRVSDERCMKVGDEIGYAIRGESKNKPGHTKITFVTTGVLLRRLQTSGGRTEDVIAALDDVSHVVIDEVHERSLDTDFLLVLLRDVLPRRRNLKVILMSATLDATVFEDYFKQKSSVGKVNIEGRTYPVEDIYLDDIVRSTGFVARSNNQHHRSEETRDHSSDVAKSIQNLGMHINYDLIATCVRYIDTQLSTEEGGILIFLPGVVEINRTLDAIRALPNMHPLPLHASLLPSEQRQVFPPPPRGKRKVIAATNVAETSITIEDIVAVIDCGKVKETSFDSQNNMVKLQEVWASRAACKQRRGRAGRVRAGKCYKLYTYNAEAKMAERPEPEIRRVPLEQLCLSVKAMGVQDISEFLKSALTPPETQAVGTAIELLRRIGALANNDMTALGRHLAMIPADLRCGKLMVYGTIFGCFESCLTIAAILTVKSPFVSPQNKRDESKAARSSFARKEGDLICDLRAYNDWSTVKTCSNYRDVRSWCEQNFLSSQTLQDISSNRSQYLASLQEAGFLPPQYQPDLYTSINAQNSNTALIRALIAGAFNPQLARIEFPDRKFAPSVSGTVELDPEARTIKFFNQENGRVFVHPSSTLFDAQGFVGNSVYMSYFNKMATTKVFIRELTPFNAYALLLFGGPITLDTLGRGLVVDGWLKLRGWARIGVLVSRLRMVLDDLLAKKIENPSLDVAGSEVVDAVRKLVEYDGMDR
ncbi:MAG: hypothetical protein LQ337_005278 [Flavoplaca oasis]|nr:MAG: hypothetical protein LQ337_005278 [Flavoplaca oasis]